MTGVREALADLRGGGTRLFLCTAKPLVYAERILSHFDLEHHFEGAYGDELGGRFQDKADLIAHILERERLEADDCCMWGDRRHDVLAASRHGIPTIGRALGLRRPPMSFAPRARRPYANRHRMFLQPFALFHALRDPDRHDRQAIGARTGLASLDPGAAPSRVRPVTLSAHGLSWEDDYAWMRADNWREVLRDPSRLPTDIRALLEAENAYADAVLAAGAWLAERAQARNARAPQGG